MTSYEVAEKVQKLLDSEHVYADVWPSNQGLPACIVSIHWGDWKHDHARAKWLCEEHGGYTISSVVTEEDGSDCYSAEHRIVFIDGYKE